LLFQDNREFIRRCEASGDLVRIRRQVDWDLEAAAVTRRACETGGPACLFEDIKDYPAGYRILGGPLATYRRVAIAMGLPADTPMSEIFAEYERREKSPIPPVSVSEAPCQEIVMRGDNIDLFQLPAPMIHEGDGGRYLVSWGFTVCRNPETGWTNWGMYRFMLLDEGHLSGQPTPMSNFARIFKEQYQSKGRAMPVAIVIGADPLSSIASTAGYRAGESEADYAGALHGTAVPLVKCLTQDLWVPAHAEIVIEGEVPPDVSGCEGPFGEYTGYRVGEQRPRVLLNASAVTHRRDPIVTMCVHGVPVDEGHVGGAIGVALALKRRLLKEELPVSQVFLPPEGASHVVVVSVSRGGADVAQRIKAVITRNRAWYNKIIVVDEDVDVFNLNEVVHALAVKCHPARGINITDEPGKGNPFTPFYSAGERARQAGAVALFDCTWPSEFSAEERPLKSSFRTLYPLKLQEKVLREWLDYGFRE